MRSRSRFARRVMKGGWLSVLVWLCVMAGLAQGEVTQAGRWVTPAGPQTFEDMVAGQPPRATGGEVWYELGVTLPNDGHWVLDFRSSMVIAEFEHWVLDASGNTVAYLSGGLLDEAVDHFTLRHGRRLELAEGNYRVLTRLSSPYYLAVPTPHLFAEADYIKPARLSALFTAVGVGIFFALGFYYLVMGLWRRSRSDLLYVGFIIGNVLFFSSALMFSKAVFGPVAFHWTSIPILFSNIIYVLFVMQLLGIRRSETPLFFRIGCGALGLLGVFLVVGLWMPAWSLEMARYGVGIFAAYGVSTGIYRALQRSRVAYLYLLANLSFLGPAVLAISAQELSFSATFTLEHLGLLAVLLEVLLLAYVMSYQVGQLHRDQLARMGLVEQARLLSHLNQSMPGMVFQLERTAQGELQAGYVSPGVRELFEVTESEVAHSLSSLMSRIHSDDLGSVVQTLERSALVQPTWQLEFRVLLPGKSPRWVSAQAHSEDLPEGRIRWHGYMADITARREAEASLRHLAEHDTLTGCFNRASIEHLFVADCAESEAEGKLLAVVFLDLDHFKPINDQHGHSTGDTLLQIVAERLQRSVRPTDRVGRLGGDEFVLVLTNLNTEADALNIAEHIREAVAQPIAIGKLALQVSASIGVGICPTHGKTLTQLSDVADQAMYRAKNQGRNTVVLAEV